MKQPVNVILKEDPNSICIPGKGARTCYKLYLDFGDDNEKVLDTENHIVKHDKYATKNGEAVIHLRTYSSGLVHSTYKAKVDTTSGNGTTISNSSFIFEETGVQLFDVVITKWNAGWMTLPIEEVKSLLPKEYALVYITNQNSYDRNTWKIVKQEDIKWCTNND